MTQRLDAPWLHWPQTQALAAAFAREHAPLRFVGGAVRDALLGKAVQDVDAATPLPPDAVMALLKKAHIRVIPTGIDHGTVTAVIDRKHFEITTLRTDVACDGRHAEVAYTADWQADAARRDFTLNALYLSPQGELFDYFGGAADALAGHVRFIRDPMQRIAEDYLRILRFFRFHAWYGKGAPDAAGLAACAALAMHIGRLSGERIQAELLKLLAAPQAAATLRLMQGQGLWPHILGFGLRDGMLHERFDIYVGRAAPSPYPSPASGRGKRASRAGEGRERFMNGCVAIFTRLAAIEALTGIALPPSLKLAGFALCAEGVTPPEAVEMLARRLRLPVKTTRLLEAVVHERRAVTAALNEAEQKRLLRRLGVGVMQPVILWNWATSGDPIDSAHPYNAMLALAEHWQPPLFPVSGDDLIQRGIAPGKSMGDLLRRLEEAWEASGYQLTKEQLLKKVAENN